MEEIRGYTQIVIETDEEKPKMIARIANDGIGAVEGYRVRLRPIYEDEKEEN